MCRGNTQVLEVLTEAQAKLAEGLRSGAALDQRPLVAPASAAGAFRLSGGPADSALAAELATALSPQRPGRGCWGTVTRQQKC